MTVIGRGIVTQLTPMAMMTMIGMTAIVGVATLFSSPALALNKASTVTVSVNIFAAPPCVINSNNTINVDFGDDLLASRIDGVQYMKPVSYTLDCTAAASNALKMSITGNGAVFDTNVLRTTNTDLGVQLMRNGQPLTLNSAFNFTYPSAPVLQAVLVKKTNATLSTGYFSGTATLVVEYQ